MTEEATGRDLLVQWLNQPVCIHLTDGRTIVGTFLCTDNDCNIILNQTREYCPVVGHVGETGKNEGNGTTSPEIVEEPRLLGLTMVPGRHIVSISISSTQSSSDLQAANCALSVLESVGGNVEKEEFSTDSV